MDEGVQYTEVQCPECGHAFAVTPGVVRKGRMAWSNKLGLFKKVNMTEAEWLQYRKQGSID